MSEQKIRTRLYSNQILQKDLSIELDRAHYLFSVLRLEEGAHVAVFNEEHGEWRAVIEQLSKKKCRVSLLSKRHSFHKTDISIRLLFAPIKRPGIDIIIEKATELGVSEIQPVLTQYSNVTRINKSRLQENIRQATEQCGRLSLPLLQETCALSHITFDHPFIFCAESGEAMPILKAMKEIHTKKISLLIGPEGGFSPKEHDFLRQQSAVLPVYFGASLLRAETAVIAALTCWQASVGEWTCPR